MFEMRVVPYLGGHGAGTRRVAQGRPVVSAVSRSPAKRVDLWPLKWPAAKTSRVRLPFGSTVRDGARGPMRAGSRPRPFTGPFLGSPLFAAAGSTDTRCHHRRWQSANDG